MPWPKLLVLVRHAESEGNVRTADERAQLDLATHSYKLTKRGEKQAKITGAYLNKRFGDFDVYYHSYYTRTKQTLELMYPESRVYEDSRLAEGQRGIWHTMTHEEVAKYFPMETARRKREGLYHYRPLGGENWPDIELRVHSFLGTLARDYAGKKVLCVVHGHWLILLQRLIHHFPIAEALRRYDESIFENASVTIYEGKTARGKSRLELKEENTIPWKDEL